MKATWVYFIKPVGMPGPIKIGFSATPSARLEAIQTWSPFPLEMVAKLPGGRDLERALQTAFIGSHSHGEWFHPVDGLLACIEKVKSGAPLGIEVDPLSPDPLRKGLPKKIAPETRERMTMHQRINGRLRGASKKAGEPLLVPPYIQSIMNDWDFCRRPSNEQFAQLEAFISGLPNGAVTLQQLRGMR